MTPLQIVQDLLPVITLQSELKVLLAIAAATLEGQPVELSISDLMSLTGLSRNSVFCGLEAAEKRGVLQRQHSKNSYVYWLEMVQKVDRNSANSAPLGVQKVDQNGANSAPPSANSAPSSSQKVDRFEKPVHLIRFKDVSKLGGISETPSNDSKPTASQSDAFKKIQGIVGLEDAHYLVEHCGFSCENAVKLWGDLLPELWIRAMSANKRYERDKAIYRFRDACKHDFDLDLEPPQRWKNLVARRAEAELPKVVQGDVLTLGDGPHTVADVTRNGMVVFEDDALPLHLSALTPPMFASV